MFITSLVELPLVKTQTWRTHNIQLANFDMASLCYLV